VTVIAAIPIDGRVLMAADTLLCRRGSRITTTHKISTLLVGPKYEQHALLAIAGSTALAQLAHHWFITESHTPDLKDPDEAKADEWAHRIAVRLCKLATTAEPPLTVDDGEVDGEALLALGPWLWLLSGQAAVPTGPTAIGSGAAEARGALYAADELGLARNYPHDALRLAVRTAIALDSNCGGEIDIEDTRLVDTAANS
jgi:hypothetical protein